MNIVDVEGELDWESVLARPLFAFLSSNSIDGPRSSPVWFLYEEGALWIIGHRTDSFPGRVEREPRSALSIVDFDVSTGTLHHIGLRGHADVVPIENARAERLLAKYLGSDRSAWDRSRFGKDLEASGGYVFVRFTPETAVVRDQSYRV